MSEKVGNYLRNKKQYCAVMAKMFMSIEVETQKRHFDAILPRPEVYHE